MVSLPHFGCLKKHWCTWCSSLPLVSLPHFCLIRFVKFIYRQCAWDKSLVGLRQSRGVSFYKEILNTCIGFLSYEILMLIELPKCSRNPRIIFNVIIIYVRLINPQNNLPVHDPSVQTRSNSIFRYRGFHNKNNNKTYSDCLLWRAHTPSHCHGHGPFSRLARNLMSLLVPSLKRGPQDRK